ncbi:SpoIIE family protein phosphatase [Streptomyces sp. NPDC057052]|uniref:SpoIIE family protein phosphatase n=1 Tax=Streptomyces sp. NPDC057052 TaxID=3346010 RepID=UPI003626F12E
MADHHVPGAPSRRFGQGPRSVAEARRFVRSALEDVLSPDAVDTAALLVSELVTNALLHARTEVEVELVVRAAGGAVRVAVSDRRPDRGPVPYTYPAYAGTGQGLALVGRLASRYGVDTGEETKTVWFELGPGATPDGTAAQPDGWETPAPPVGTGSGTDVGSRTAVGPGTDIGPGTDAGPGTTVTLIDVPGALYSASQQHRHTLLREVALALAAGHVLGVAPAELAAAQDMNHLISTSVTAALRHQAGGAEIRSLPLSVPADAGPAARALRAVLDLAEEAARDGRFLTLPALPRGRAFHEWLCDQIIGQLAGEPPTAWTVVPREPGSSLSEPVSWDADQVRASRVPTIAADERGTIVAVNGPAADLLGWHPDDLVGRRLTTLMPEHLRQRHRTAFTSLLLSGQPGILGRSVPLPALHRDGRLVPIRLFVQSQEMPDGRTVFVAQLTPRAAAPDAASHPPGRARPPAPQQPGGPAPSAVPQNEGHGAGMSALERLSLLADTGNTLSNATGLNEGVQQVARVLTERLADWCGGHRSRARAARGARVGFAPRPPGAADPGEYEGRLPPVSQAARGPLARALSGAGPLLLTEPPPPGRATSPLDTHYAELLRSMDTRSAVVAPLRARRQVIGALTVARGGAERPFTEEDLPLIDDLARALGLGVDNARLYQETRNIAERLQRSLLPVLPEIGHLRISARYAASSTTAQVGGDWYDSFVLPSGDTALVIGDVAGHNLDAAIAMSQLRSMLRGIAVDRQEPPETVLRRLDMANHSLYREATATCIYGLLKGPADGPWELVHSSAGHLPPLLISEDGRTRYLEEGAGVLLGLDPDLPRPRARDAIPAHSTVLLYTDGLIERRDECLGDGMDRLRRHAAALAREPLDVFCDELLIGLGADNDDDIALLAVRPTPRVGSTAGRFPV